MKKIIMMAALLAVATGAQAALVHHWEFNGDTTDSAGSNDATLNGTAGLATDAERGSYASFDGGSTSYASTGVTYDPDGTFTWALWVKNADTNKMSAIIMGNRRDGVADGGGADFSPREFVKVTPGSTIFRPNNSANDVYYSNPDTLTVAAGWTHIAIVKDGADVTPYTDGVAGTTVTLDNTFTQDPMPLFLGGDNTTTRGIEYFDGGIDDVRIYDNALTASEVAALIPEPATLGMVAVFGGGILFIRRRFMI